MSDFERALQDLDVATASMDNSMSQQAAVLHNEKECNSLLQQLIDENKMDISLSAPNASNIPVAGGVNEEEEEREDIMATLQQVRNSWTKQTNKVCCIYSLLWMYDVILLVYITSLFITSIIML